jgi:hypothetical protein
MNRIMASVGVAAAFGLAAAGAGAHHSFAVNFNMAGSAEIHGVLRDIRIRNPHSLLEMDVEQSDGSVERWVVETHAVPLLARVGIDAGTFAEGEEVTVRGMPSRIEGRRLIFGLEFVKADGTSYVWRPDSLVPDGGLSSAEQRALRQGLERFEGVWGYQADPNPHTFEDSPLPLTQAGLDARANFDPFNTSAMQCIPPNLPGILYVPYLYGIEVDDDVIRLHHEYFAVARTVPLSGAAVAVEPSGMFGRATARIEGTAVVVDSTGFPDLAAGMATAFDPNGVGADVPSSAQKRFVERYTVSPDGETLTVDYTIEDPVFLSAPYQGRTQWSRLADGTPIVDFECDPGVAAQSSDQSIR